MWLLLKTSLHNFFPPLETFFHVFRLSSASGSLPSFVFFFIIIRIHSSPSWGTRRRKNNNENQMKMQNMKWFCISSLHDDEYFLISIIIIIITMWCITRYSSISSWQSSSKIFSFHIPCRLNLIMISQNDYEEDDENQNHQELHDEKRQLEWERNHSPFWLLSLLPLFFWWTWESHDALISCLS